MGNKNKKYSKSFIIHSTILCIITLILVIGNILFFYEKHKIKHENIELNNQFSSNNNLFNSIDSDKKEIILNIEFLDNIDELTNNKKNEYFNSIKLLEDDILSGKSQKKIAYLTFDDGPYNLTETYLNILDKYNVKGTFFVIGLGKTRCLDKRDRNCYELYKEITSRGHTIANHTYSHGIWTGLYSSANAFMDNVIAMENIIKEQTGIITNIVRFPGGSRTAGNLKNPIIEKLRQRGYGWVDWTAQDGDGGDLKTKEEAWNNFISSIDSNIEVVLLHDYSTITVSILPNIIEYLQEKNYILLPLFYESNMINK